MSKAKPYSISKMAVWRAYEHVKRNKGSAGIDDQSIEDFERYLKGNLYKVWNRMSSGTYFPPAVKTVAIPKKDGSKRYLGIPTVADRVAQTVVKMELEPVVEPKFHSSSYGYRPNKSTLQAVESAKVNCWVNAWVIDLDIKGFFDNIRHDLLMRAVRHHTNCKWTLLYIERWLKAPVQNEDGSVSKRERGIPQGGAMSPLLANIFLHHVFDDWMARKYPDIKFERFADDIIVHCWKLGQAKHLLYEIRCRMYECGLILHSEKTKIVFCEDDKRNWGEGYPTSFDFLGFTFRKRTARGRNGTLYNGFQPAMSMDARRKISKTIRSWHIGRRGDLSLEEMSKDLNPTIRGWVNYYGKYYKSAFTPIRKQFHVALTRWAMRKYKKLNDRPKVASEWIYQIARREPHLFAFWEAFYESKG